MILTTVFGAVGTVVGGYAGSIMGALGGKPLRHMFLFGAMAGGTCGGVGFVLDHAFGNFDEAAPQVITAQQQQSITDCVAKTPENMESVITLDSSGKVTCLYAPK